MSDENKDAIAVINRALAKWPGDGMILNRNIPFRQVFIDCAGTDIAYLKDKVARDLVEELGAEVAKRIGL